MYLIHRRDVDKAVRVLGPLSYTGWGAIFLVVRDLSLSQLARLANAGVQVW